MAHTKLDPKSPVFLEFLKVSSKRSLTLIMMYLLYVLFVSSPDKIEMTVGLVISVAATVAAVIFRTGENVGFCPSYRDVRQFWRIPGLALEGGYQLFKSLFLQLLGIRKAGSCMRAVPFSAWKTDCRSSGRAALAELYTTMTPNSVVLGISHKQKLLLLHQVVPNPPSRMLLNLGGHS